jgi:hypothetical protein
MPTKVHTFLYSKPKPAIFLVVGKCVCMGATVYPIPHIKRRYKTYKHRLASISFTFQVLLVCIRNFTTNSGWGLLGYDTTYWCGSIPTIRRTMFPPSLACLYISSYNEYSACPRAYFKKNFLRNVGILSHTYTAFSLLPEDGCSKVLRNDGILPQHHKVSQIWRPRLESSSPRRAQISHHDLMSKWNVSHFIYYTREQK